MRLATLALALLPAVAFAQDTIPVEDAPFKEACALSARLAAHADFAGTSLPVPP